LDNVSLVLVKVEPHLHAGPDAAGFGVEQLAGEIAEFRVRWRGQVRRRLLKAVIQDALKLRLLPQERYQQSVDFVVAHILEFDRVSPGEGTGQIAHIGPDRLE